MTNESTIPVTYEPDDAADDDLAAERAGQSSTVEEAMDAATDEEGHVEERIQEGREGVAQATVDLAANATCDVVDNATSTVEQQLSDAQARLHTVSTPNGTSHV